MKEHFYSSAEVCKAVGISKNTLIRWEESKLIPVPRRDGRGWRVWSKTDLHRIIEVKKAMERRTVYQGRGRKLEIFIIGYGARGAVWAKNLRDSGASVTVLLRKNSPAVKTAVNDGMEVKKIDDAISQKGIFCVLIPDEKQKDFFAGYSDVINPEAVFVFAHGFSVGYQDMKLNAKKLLIAPKASSEIMRSNYLDGKTTPAAFSMEYAGSGSNKELLNVICAMLGLSPVIETGFEEEAVASMFSEQVILCGGVPALLVKAFDIMVKEGINPKLAIQECIYELSYVLGVMKEKGLGGLLKSMGSVSRKGGELAWKSINSGRSMDDILLTHFHNVSSKGFLKDIRDSLVCEEEVLKKAEMFDKALLEANL